MPPRRNSPVAEAGVAPAAGAAIAARGSIEAAHPAPSPAPAHCMKRRRVMHGLWFMAAQANQGW
jgi:hypothetical protein